MEFIGTVFFMLGAFLFLNLLFALLYILTRDREGRGFIDGLTMVVF